ncbi:MAG: SBBP repeat-containing protein [Chitinophagales bacterium]|nr:SBBP repeat-containing protein [Chitinophagales bacterium]MDW8418350.1 SBBP repeat-containing protein [Chitinophagales bacterium]
MKGIDVWITRQGMNITLYRPGETPQKRDLLSAYKSHFSETPLTIHRISMQLQGVQNQITHEGHQRLPGVHHYLLRNDPAKHYKHVPLYKEVYLYEIYPGIDMRYYFSENRLRFDFVVHPGANPSQIAFKIAGTYAMHTNERGDIVLATSLGELLIADLHFYQSNKQKIRGTYSRQGELWKPVIPDYDNKKPLIIDPMVVATFLGGTSTEEIYDMVQDNQQFVYVAGATLSVDYDTTVGALQTSNKGFYDAVVSKLNPNLNKLIFSTYVGGGDADRAWSTAVDNNYNIYLTGHTGSIDFYTTPNCIQPQKQGPDDAFVCKLNSDGSAYVYSTFLGGSSSEHGESIAVDNNGYAYIAGNTNSANFDITPNTFQTSLAGDEDVFVTKIDTNAQSIIFSTYIGGIQSDYPRDMVIDHHGYVYLTGNTSSDYDVTNGALQPSPAGSTEAFITKLDADGSKLIFSTYYGGQEQDVPTAIKLGPNGNIYLVGYTTSNNLQTTPNAYQKQKAGAAMSNDIFIACFNPTFTTPIYVTYLGGFGNDYAHDLWVDTTGQAFITGYTLSTDFPTAGNAIDTLYKGAGDVIFSSLSADGSSLSYSTFLGGTDSESGEAISSNNAGSFYIAGNVMSTSFYTQPGVYQPTLDGHSDGFVCKIQMSGIPVSAKDLSHQHLVLKLYPTVSDGELWIENPTEQDLTLALYNTSGVMLQYLELKPGLQQISLNLPAGIYLLKSENFFSRFIIH